MKPVPFQIPQPYITQLDNGLKVVIFEDKRLPLVSFRLAFLAGDATDPLDTIGLNSAMAGMLTEGTATYSSRELAEKIERLGASISGNSSDDFTIIAASSLSIYSSEIFQLFAEIVFRPSFPEDELDLYRRNAVENIKFQRSQPGFLANEQTARILYGDHPYSRVAPSAADIEKLTREALGKAHERLLVPNNAILVVVGDIEREEFLSEVNEQFGLWARAESGAPRFAAPPERDGRTMTIVDRPGSAQSNIVLANIAMERNNPDYFAVTVMNQVLGAGASSRVFMNLREEKGYTYGAYTRLDTRLLAGDFEATAEVRTAVTGDSLHEFFYELDRIRNEPVSDDELTDAKNFLTGVFPIRAETQEGLTNLIVNQQLYRLPTDYLQTYRDQVDSISAEDVQRVANKYILPEKLAIVIVGDAGEVLPQVKKYSDAIEVFDTEGNAMDVSGFEVDADGEPDSVAGHWDLSLDFQGRKVQVTLVLKQDGEKITGTIETILGSGEITEGKVRGDKINATASTEIQGQAVDFVIAGSVDGERMTGTLSTAIIPDSLAFEGSRKA